MYQLNWKQKRASVAAPTNQCCIPSACSGRGRLCWRFRGGGDQNEAWLLSGFLTLGKSAHLSEPQFPGLWSGDKHVWGGKSDSSLDKC